MFSDFVKSAADIIRAGSASDRAFLALIIVVVAGLAYAFFRKGEEPTRFRIFLIVLCFLLAMVGAVMYRKGAFKAADSAPEIASVPVKPPGDNGRPSPPPAAPVSEKAPAAGNKLDDLKVILYNGADDPEFFLNGKKTQPAAYSSGIATFHLAVGSYGIRAEYTTRTCSAEFSVPAPAPVAADCRLR